MGGGTLEINVVCFYWGAWGGIHWADYINRLYVGVARHLHRPFRFICFADAEAILDRRVLLPQVEILPLPVMGWLWNLKKMYAYCPDNGINSGQVLVFDLDVIITGELSALAMPFADFTTCSGAYRGSAMGGSLMSFPAGYGADWLWPEIVDNYKYWEDKTRGSERRFFNRVFKKYGRPWQSWDSVTPGQVVSYKLDCKQGLPVNARVVRFHGRPRPHEVDTTIETNKWIEGYWK